MVELVCSWRWIIWGVSYYETLQEDAQDHDIFILLTDALYVVVNSWNNKGKAFKKHILKDIVPRGFDARIEEIQEKHRRAIEEKDAALALLNDDLQNREYENVALQAQRDVYKDELQKCQDIIAHLRRRYADHVKDPDKDNIVMIIEKIPPPRKMSFMSIPTTLRGHNDGSLTQKDDDLKHNTHFIDL